MSASYKYVTGGTIAPGSPSYVVRAADAELLELCDRGEFAYVLTSRQMGKSSLVARTMAELRSRDILVAAIDLNEIGSQGVTPDQWFAGLITEMEAVCGGDSDLFGWWARNAGLSHAQRFFLYLSQVFLPGLTRQLVVFIDEIDATIRLDFTDDFFAALRTTHNARALDPQFEKISFVLLGVATPAELIHDQSRTPFNIGTRVELADFGLEDALPLVRSLEHDAQLTQRILDSVLRWTGGQPYLVQRVCAALDALPELDLHDIDQVVGRVLLSEQGRSDPHFQFLSQYLLATPADMHAELFATYEVVLRGRDVPCRDASAVHSRLRLAGVVRREQGRLVLRNQVYGQLFGLGWVRKHRKKNWIIANRRLLGALAATTAGALLFAWIAAFAWLAQERAQKNEQTAQASELAAAAQSELMRGDMGLGLLLTKYALRMNAESAITHSSALIAADVSEGTILLGAATANWRLAAMSPDGRRVATADAGKQVHEWSTTTGSALGVRDDLGEAPSALAYSRDGNWLFAGGANGAALLWDLRQATAPVRLPRHPSRVVNAVFSPESDFVVSSDAAGHLAIMEVKSARLVKVIDAHAGPVHFVSMAEGSNRLCAGTSDGRVHCWKGSPPVFERSIRAHARPLNGAALTADGEKLFTAAWNEGTKVWRSADGRQIANLTQRGEVVYASALSPDGAVAVTGDDVGRLRIWDTASGRMLNTLLAHAGPVWRIEFSANGRRIITAGEDELSKVWDVATARLVAQGPIRNGSVRLVALSPDGRTALSLNSAGTAAVWSVDRNLLLAEFADRDDRAATARFDGLGNLVLMHEAGRISLRSGDGVVSSAGLSKTPMRPVLAFGFEASRPGALLLHDDGGVSQWDGKATPSPVSSATLGPEASRRVEFSPDGRSLVTVDARSAAVLHDVATAAVIAKLNANGRRVTTVAFNAQSTIVATYGQEAAIDLWDARTGTRLRTIATQLDSVRFVALSPSGSHLLAVGSGGRAAVYAVDKGEVAYELNAAVPQPDATPFSEDGSRIILAGSDGATWIYEAGSGRPVSSLRGYKGRPSAVRLNRTADRAITGSDDAHVYVWDAASGTRLLELRGHTSSVTDVRFSPDSRRAVTLDDRGIARLWDIARAQLSSGDLAAWLDRQIDAMGRRISPAECLTYFPESKVVRPPECKVPLAGSSRSPIGQQRP